MGSLTSSVEQGRHRQENGGQKKNDVLGIYSPGSFSDGPPKDTVDARLCSHSRRLLECGITSFLCVTRAR